MAEIKKPGTPGFLFGGGRLEESNSSLQNIAVVAHDYQLIAQALLFIFWHDCEIRVLLDELLQRTPLI